MSVINEISQITPAQMGQFMPKERFNVAKSTIQKTKSTITSLNSGIVTDTFKNTASTPYDFVIGGGNSMGVIDLSQCYFNIAGTLNIEDANGNKIPTKSQNVVLGNLFVSSLFQSATLEIGGSVVALNSNPGIDANMQAVMKFDNQDLRSYCESDREFMINDTTLKVNVSHQQVHIDAGQFEITGANTGTTATFKSKDNAHLPAEYYDTTIIYNNPTGTNFSTNCTAVKSATFYVNDDGSFTGYIYSCNNTTAMNPQDNAELTLGAANITIRSKDDIIDDIEACSVMEPNTTDTVDIPFRCKLYLSDLFNYTVDSLDYIFNREVKITLTRSATNFIIANIIHGAAGNKAVINVTQMKKFELVCFSYLLTDSARQQMLQFYSKPIETLYGTQTTNLTPLYNFDSQSEQTITLPLTVNFDTKAIILAFPKCSNALVPLSTPDVSMVSGQIGATTGNTAFQPSWYLSNSNSYNYAGLRYIRIANTNNASIYTYDFQGTQCTVTNPTGFVKSFDYTNAADNAAGQILDYREAYDQFKKLRLLFGKAPDNALDYWTWLKDYCIIPIDLAGSNIPPNTRILVTLQFASWGTNYSPLYYGNNKKQESNKLTTNLLAIYLGHDVLQYNPDGTCIVKHVLSANPNEKQTNLI